MHYKPTNFAYGEKQADDQRKQLCPYTQGPRLGLSSLVKYFSELITGFCMHLKKQCYKRKLKDLVSKEKRKSDG